MTKKEIATIDSNSNNNSKRTTTKGQMKITLTGTKYYDSFILPFTIGTN